MNSGVNTTPLFASVVVETGFDEPLDYMIPLSLKSTLQVGMLVRVPLRKRLETALVLELKSTSPFEEKLKEIDSLLSDEPLLSPHRVYLALWMSHYYCCSLRRVIQVMLPKVAREVSAATEGPLWVSRQMSIDECAQAAAHMRSKQAPRARVLDVMLKVRGGVLLSELLEKAQVSPSPVQTLQRDGFIKVAPLPDATDLSVHRYFRSPAKTLSHEQQQALETIKLSLDAQKCQVHLLYGVTGSGKTEVYLQAMHYALAKGGSCLLLVPEISLTPQTIDRIRARFEQQIAILHYRLSAKQRTRQWEEIRQGRIKIIVGARSAIFCPCDDLSLIIIDEEHEGSYKSEESPHYHVREVAIKRAQQSGATIILGSATPSLESYYRAKSGQYQLLQLCDRASDAKMPQVQVVDMLPEYEKAQGLTLFSSTLLDELKATLERGEQAMLFLNRRGYFAQAQCLGCGQSIMCPNCDLNLTYHRSALKMICHLCHYNCAPVQQCPHCKSPNQLKFRGWGTEHVQSSLHKILPGVKTVRIDADTTRHKGSLEQLLREFRTHKADVIIGTQMIAKGHHFPGLTLVAVLNPDSQLLIPDFRASEHLFQLLVQVFGRSGRSHLPGKVIVQTAQQHAQIFQLAAKHNYTAFALQELFIRKRFGYPPYVHLIKITVRGPNEDKVIGASWQLHSQISSKLPSSCMISSPGEGAWRRIQGDWRQIFLIKTAKPHTITAILKECKKNLETPSILIDYDVDCLHIG